MKVKMLTLECGPNGTFPVGSERDVSDAHGMQLVLGGYAIDITPAAVAETAAVVVPEVAAVATEEVAAVAPTETRRGRRK